MGEAVGSDWLSGLGAGTGLQGRASLLTRRGLNLEVDWEARNLHLVTLCFQGGLFMVGKGGGSVVALLIIILH